MNKKNRKYYKMLLNAYAVWIFEFNIAAMNTNRIDNWNIYVRVWVFFSFI